ncbi:MAG: response regulator transcription factor [Actinobacteria bacterium]|jgi:DNA-binding response OmpR family regulator|nr:response regulator transcription factor [Actinomycetota bacterium]MBT7013445.1 response regulator transcription factor [Actinomycetota bacterium]MDA9637141.1 response regulator transcription factor [bacterium]MDA9685956.1 response regulator transcription factor [Candidatus Actinomarina sp.]
MSVKVLLVEDEKSIADGIIYNLKNEGLKVTHVDEGKIALDIFDEEHFDLLILDIMLPEVSGLEICQSIRKSSNVPIIMLTAKDDENDKIRGLEMGADDYITKPFSVKELISRIKAVLRRTKNSELLNGLDEDINSVKEIKIGNIAMNPLRYEARIDDEIIELRPREFELLYYLCENAGNIVSRDKLFSKVWGYSFAGNSKTLDVHIQRIRERIEVNPKSPQRLTTIRGVGYKLND